MSQITVGGRTFGVGWLLAVLAVAILTFDYTYGVWERDATRLYWSQHRAYLVSERLREGWIGNWWAVAWESIRGLGGRSGRRTDRRSWLEVTEISSDGTTLAATLPVVPEHSPTLGIVFEDHLYGGYRGRSLAKWDDGKFVALGPEERQRVVRGGRGGDFRDVDGWSSETSLLDRSHGERRYPLVLEGVPIEVVVNQGPRRRSVSVRYPGRAPETILDLPNDVARVNASTYRELLRPPVAQ